MNKASFIHLFCSCKFSYLNCAAWFYVFLLSFVRFYIFFQSCRLDNDPSVFTVLLLFVFWLFFRFFPMALSVCCDLDVWPSLRFLSPIFYNTRTSKMWCHTSITRCKGLNFWTLTSMTYLLILWLHVSPPIKSSKILKIQIIQFYFGW